jgi:hypothetical protein
MPTPRKPDPSRQPQPSSHRPRRRDPKIRLDSPTRLGVKVPSGRCAAAPGRLCFKSAHPVLVNY